MKREPETAEVLNNIFSDIVKNLIILESMRISIQILKTLKIAISKNNNNGSITANQRKIIFS